MEQDKEYIRIATQELLHPQSEVTKQYLAVMEVEISKGVPKLARINYKDSNNAVQVYFHIKNERFFIAINLSSKPEVKVKSVWIESGHRVYLTATSEELTYQELTNLVSLYPLSGWSQNDLMKNNMRKYEFSRVYFEPNKNEAYELEEKLFSLLEELEKHRKEVIELSKQANTYISVCKYQYISANAGIHLDTEIINKLQKLNLELDIDTYIVGTEIKN